MHDLHQPDVIFGLSPVCCAGTLFVITYLLIVTERLNRAIISRMAAALIIMSGMLTQEAAVKGVDFNTIGLLTGMMIIVSITRESDVFQYLAIRSAKLVKADPWGILVMVTGSGFLPGREW